MPMRSAMSLAVAAKLPVPSAIRRETSFAPDQRSFLRWLSANAKPIPAPTLTPTQIAAPFPFRFGFH